MVARFAVQLVCNMNQMQMKNMRLLNKTYLLYSNSLLLYNNGVTSIDNTQLSLYMSYKRKVSLLSLSSYAMYSIFNCIHISPLSVWVLFTWVLMFLQHTPVGSCFSLWVVLWDHHHTSHFMQCCLACCGCCSCLVDLIQLTTHPHCCPHWDTCLHSCPSCHICSMSRSYAFA
jgi:hypothetical protein